MSDRSRTRQSWGTPDKKYRHTPHLKPSPHTPIFTHLRGRTPHTSNTAHPTPQTTGTPRVTRDMSHHRHTQVCGFGFLVYILSLVSQYVFNRRRGTYSHGQEKTKRSERARLPLTSAESIEFSTTPQFIPQPEIYIPTGPTHESASSEKANYNRRPFPPSGTPTGDSEDSGAPASASASKNKKRRRNGKKQNAQAVAAGGETEGKTSRSQSQSRSQSRDVSVASTPQVLTQLLAGVGTDAAATGAGEGPRKWRKYNRKRTPTRVNRQRNPAPNPDPFDSAPPFSANERWKSLSYGLFPLRSQRYRYFIHFSRITIIVSVYFTCELLITHVLVRL